MGSFRRVVLAVCQFDHVDHLAFIRYIPAHLSIHDTLTATLDSGICKSGGDFGFTTYS